MKMNVWEVKIIDNYFNCIKLWRHKSLNNLDINLIKINENIVVFFEANPRLKYLNNKREKKFKDIKKMKFWKKNSKTNWKMKRLLINN